MSIKKRNIRSPLDKATAIVALSSALLIVYIFILFIAKTNINFNLPIDTGKFGHFGDIIGGLVGTILTFLATILLYYTYRSQKEGLKTQKKELELSRELFSKQNFENTFFNMLNVHRELRKEISFDMTNAIIKKTDGNVLGKSFFSFAHEDFKEFWKYEYPHSAPFNPIFGEETYKDRHKKYSYRLDQHSQYSEITDLEGNSTSDTKRTTEQHLKDITDLKYPSFWEIYSNYLGDYFRNIYHILKYLSTEKSREKKDVVTEPEKKIINLKYKKYADILQSQMSYSELFFMFYNALTYTKVKPYIKEFDFVENLTVKNLLHPKHAEFKGMGNIKNDFF